MKIEKNVRMPTNINRKYPFGDMSVGDSFEVPVSGTNQQKKRDAVSARTAAILYGKRHGLKFTVRKMPDGTVRCWRIG